MIIDNEKRSYTSLNILTAAGLPRALSNLFLAVQVSHTEYPDTIHLSAYVPRGNAEDIVVETSETEVRIHVNNLGVPMLASPMLLAKRKAKVDEIESSFDPHTRLLYITIPLQSTPAAIKIPVRPIKK